MGSGIGKEWHSLSSVHGVALSERVLCTKLGP
jgi:hypothetical protein